MTLQEIKDAVNAGKIVYWVHEGYKVIRFGYNNDYEYYIQFRTGNVLGLTHADGVTLNGDESEFYIAE